MPTAAPTHQAKPRRRSRHDDDRISARKRGYDTTWQKLAKAWLAEHPLCVECSNHGETRLGVLVDHIEPVKRASHRRLDPTNLQTLCRPHHAVKTARGD